MEITKDKLSNGVTAIFIRFGRKDALRLIQSLSAQMVNNSLNNGREEFYGTFSSGKKPCRHIFRQALKLNPANRTSQRH